MLHAKGGYHIASEGMLWSTCLTDNACGCHLASDSQGLLWRTCLKDNARDPCPRFRRKWLGRYVLSPKVHRLIYSFATITQPASYQIYAVKSSTTTADPNIIAEPLLRWWDAYPTATSSPALMGGDELLSRLRDPSRCHECAVIDVRGDDHIVCIIKTPLHHR